MVEATIEYLANLATSTSVDQGLLAAFNEANARLAKQLEERSNKIKALLKKECTGRISFTPSLDSY
jgi:ribosome-associated translation inhibitor RaiA